MSSQSERRVSQSGWGRFTRRPVLWLVSATVKPSLAKGPVTAPLKIKEGMNGAVRRNAARVERVQPGRRCDEHEEAGTGDEEGLQSDHDVSPVPVPFFAGLVGRNGRKSVGRRLSAELSIFSDHCDEAAVRSSPGPGEAQPVNIARNWRGE